MLLPRTSFKKIMFKLLFLVILIIMLELAYAPSNFSLSKIFPFKKILSRFSKKVKHNPHNVIENSPSVVKNPPLVVKIPQKDHSQKLSISVRYRPLIVEELETGKLESPVTIERYFITPGSASDTTFPKKKFFCPIESDEKKNSCLVPTFQQLCTIPARPLIQPLLYETEENEEQPASAANEIESGEMKLCGPKGEGRLYAFSYRKEEFEVYTFCYDHKNKETIYAQYFVSLPQLLFEEKLNEGEEIPFEMSTEDFGYFDNFFETVKLSYANSQSAYKAQKLVPPNDLAQGAWKIPTFHYVNVRPLHEHLIQIWGKIGELVLNSWAAKRNDPHLFYTGAFKITKGDENVEYVYEKNIRIPELWIKIVIVQVKIDQEQGLAILLNNMPNNSNLEWDNNLCEQNFCDIPNRKDEVFEGFADAGRHVRCCRITKPILTLFNLDEQFNADDVGLLMIDDLTSRLNGQDEGK